MTPRAASAAAILSIAALALSACSGGAGAPSSAPVETAPPTAASSDTGTPPAASSDAAAAAGGLIGMLGTTDDPDAYAIGLADESGSPVESLPAGEYTLTFADRSDIHNFRLTGPGGVDVSTDVVGSDETTVEITLVPGTYTVICDPHPSTMSSELEVTG